MIIEESDFKLIPIDDCSQIFDLELLYTVKPRNGEPRQVFKNAGYGLTLENAVRKILHYRVDCKHKGEAIKLRSYYLEFKEELNKLKDLCSNL
jgi:hypothetical protein